MGFFNYNGKIYSEGSAVISADNRGLRYGDGLFETIKSQDNNLQFIDDHLERLWEGMIVLQFRISQHFSKGFLQKQIIELLRKNMHHKMARVRLTVFRGDGGLYDETDHTLNYLIQTWALPDDIGYLNDNGLVLGIYTEIKKSVNILSNLKHNNFLPYAMAALHVKKQKWNDAVLLNTSNRLCDTTIANIFFIKNKMICTPALKEGCIAGIMRKNVIHALSEKGYAVTEGGLTVDELYDADEVFLTNSIHNIRWVQSIGDKKYGNSQVQKIYSALF